MTDASRSMPKMLRWLKDKKKTKHGKKSNWAEDDYGFRKKQIILQETENGHSVIIKDNETTLVYPQSFCQFTYRARMPTPVQNVKETSSHIYDEIHETSVQTRLQFDPSENEADIIKDTHKSRENMVDFKNAIEVGPYLIVPIVSQSNSENDGEILETGCAFESNNACGTTPTCNFALTDVCECSSKFESDLSWQRSIPGTNGVQKDTKVVLTRCVKSKNEIVAIGEPVLMCSNMSETSVHKSCSVEAPISDTDLMFRTMNDSPSANSNSVTLTETSDSSMKPLLDGLDDRAFEENDIDEKLKEISKSEESNSSSTENELLGYSVSSEYEVHLSRIENNLKLKHNVRKIIENSEKVIQESAPTSDGVTEEDSMTYVSSLTEYSSAASRISGFSVERAASDDSSNYCEYSEECTKLRDQKRDSRVNLERSLSAPGPCAKKLSCGFHNNNTLKKSKDKTQTKTKRSQYPRTNSLDCSIYKALSDEDKEMYLFPSGEKSDTSSSSSCKSRHSRSKPVLAPQPTPVYMDPYRGKPTNNHNRLLGDLIRMNYDKQLFIH